MSDSVFSAPLPGDVDPAALLRGVLEGSLTGIQLLRPVYAPEGVSIVDFAPAYTNPAGLRMLGLAQQPGGTLLTRYPHALATGILAYYQRAFAASEPLGYEVNYQADELDNYFRFQARRQGPLLLVSFSDTSDQSRSAVEQALRESQAREQEAHAEAERQRQRLHEVLLQLPAHVAVHNGPEQEYTLVNPAYQRLAPGRNLLGQTVRAAWPELTDQGILDTLDRVYQTGEPFVGTEVPLHVDFARDNHPTLVYYNCYYLPLRDANGRVSGVLDYSYDVTEQVLARQHVEQLNRAAQAARAEAETQRQRFHEVLMQLPAQVAVNQGPDHVFALVNSPYQQMFPTRSIQGRPAREALPELAGQQFFELLDRVYQTGEPFYSRAMPAEVDFTNTGRLERRYVDVFFQALHDAQGRVDGVLNFSYDVTEQVRARQQVEQLNQELEARVQARTQEAEAARAEAEHQRLRLENVFQQAPAAIAVYGGPELVFELVNPVYQALLPGRPLLGKPVREAFPEAAELPVFDTLRQVYETGVTHHEQDQLIPVPGPDGTLVNRYFNFTLQARYDEQQRVDGVVGFGFEVTEQVRASRQSEALQAELLATAQRQAAAREGFYHVLEQAPVGVTLLRGRELRFEYVNPAFQRIFPDRPLRGLTVATAFPEGESQGFIALHQQVYDTGIPYFGTEVPFVEAPVEGQPPRTTYFDFSYQAMREGGQTVGICAFAFDVTDKVLARQMRETQHRELTALFEQAPAGVCILDGPELVYTFANPAYEAILPGRELLGRSVLDVIPELRGTEIETLLRQVYTTGTVYRTREHCIPLADPDGSGELENRYFTLVYQPWRDTNQRIMGVLNLVVEVTGQVLARQQAEANAQQVRDLVAGIPFPIGLYAGPEFRIELANQAILAGWGKGEDVIGQRFADVLPELTAQGVVAQLQQVRASGEALHLRGQQLEVVMAGQPQTFYYNYNFTPLHDAQGQLYGILNTAADVTDQVVARQRLEAYAAELQESEARFRTLADAAPNIVWDLRPDGSVRYVNTYCLAFLGISLEEFVASNWGAYLLPEDVAPTQQQLEQAIRERTLFSVEHRMRRHDGQYRWLLTQGGPSYYPSGELYGYVGSAIDITELKQANEQLTRTNIDLDNFIYTASHDLKAPITNIEGLLLALEHELPAAARTGDVSLMLTMMQDATERFRRTITHLTDLSRLQKEHNPASDAVTLAPVVEDVRLDITPLLLQTQGQLTVAVPADLTVTFAEKNLRSVVYNLLSNAFKYHHPDRVPEVHLRSFLTDGYVVLEVQDNGLGLDLARGQERLFGMFQRLHTHVEGTGVGLYMVKRILENAGGRIEVDSQLGEGTTFRVFFRR